MKAYILPVLLQVAGICVIIAEIFIPSLGILTIIALAVLFYSVYLVYTGISANMGMIFTGIDIILVPVLLVAGVKILAKSSLSLKQELSKKDGVFSQKQGLESLIEMKGRTVTDLRPAGIAEVDLQRLDVVTDGEYINADTPVVVTGVTGNRIIVEEIK